MQNNRIKNTKRNIVWGTVNKIITIILPFLVRTVLIYLLGVDYVGISSLFSSILQVLSLADLGFASAIVYSMYKPLAENDSHTVGALLGFYKKIYRVIGFIILGVGLVLLPFLKYLIKGSYPSDINLYVIYLIYLFNTSLSYFLFAYKRSLLIAMQRKDITDNIDSILRIATCIVQILVLLLVKNYYVYTIFIPVSTLMENILCELMATHLFPNIICNDDLGKHQKDDIIEKTKGLFIYKVCGVTRNSLDNIFISIFLGITQVGIYSNYYYLMTSVRGFMDAISTGMSASVGNSVATESIDKNYENLNIFTFIFAWLSGWCTVCMLCLYQPFMILWVGKKNIFSFSVVIAICIYFYVWTAGDIRSQYTDASGLWWKEKIRSITETIGNIVMNYLFVQIWGVFGIVIATAVSIVVIGLPWSTRIVFKNYFIGKSWIKYLIIQLFYAVSTVAACFITYYVCSMVPGENIRAFIIKIFVCIFLPNIFYLIIFFKTRIGNKSFLFIKSKLFKNN